MISLQWWQHGVVCVEIDIDLLADELGVGKGADEFQPDIAFEGEGKALAFGGVQDDVDGQI
jgi:hypothetical protein